MEQLEPIGKRIKQALYLRDMKRIELSRLTNISAGNITHYINGDFEPKTENIYLIAKALNVSEVWLLGYDVSIERTPYPTIKEDAKSSLYKLVDSLSLEECEIAARLIKSIIKGE